MEAKTITDNLKDKELWEECILKVIQEKLIPQKSAGWFVLCYVYIQETITNHCPPDFNLYYTTFYDALAKIVNGRQFYLNEAIVMAFTSHWPQETLEK